MHGNQTRPLPRTVLGRGVTDKAGRRHGSHAASGTEGRQVPSSRGHGESVRTQAIPAELALKRMSGVREMERKKEKRAHPGRDTDVRV